MAADQVKENPEAKAADNSASDAQPDAPATAEKEAEGASAKLSEEANDSGPAAKADDQTTSTDDSGDTTPKVGQDASQEVVEKGEQAEATLAEKLQEDSTPKSLEELKALAPGDLTPEQRTRLGLPPLEISDLRDLAKVRAGGRVEVELNGTKIDLTDSVENGLKGENVQTRVQADGSKIQVDSDTGAVRIEYPDGKVGLKFEKGGEQVYIEQNANDGSINVIEGQGQIYRASDLSSSDSEASDSPDESEKYIESGTGAEDGQYTGKALTLNGINTLEAGKSKSYDDVVIEHDGKPLFKFDDADMVENQWEANWKLSIPEGADSTKLDGVGTRSLIAGEDGTTTEVMQSEDGSVFIRKGDQYFVANSGFYGQVTEGAKAKEAFQAEAEKYNAGARVAPRAMVSADINYVVQTRDGTELVEVGKDRSVDVKIPDDAQVIRNDNGSRVFLNDGTQMVQSENGTTILNSDGRVIQVGTDGSLNQYARGDKKGAEAWESEAGKFELSDIKVAGSDGNSLDDPGSWSLGGFGKAFMDYSGLNTAIDFGSDIYNAGIDWGADLFSTEPGVCTVDKDFQLDWDTWSNSDLFGDLTTSLSEDLDFQLSSGNLDFKDIALTGKSEIKDLTKAEVARQKANEEQAEYINALTGDDSKLVNSSDGKSASDVATDSLNSTLTRTAGKDGSQIDKAALDKALAGPLEGITERTNEKGDIVQVDETTGMQRIKHSDGSVTVKFGEGKDAVAVTEKDGQREYITGDGAMVETNDGRIYSSLGDVDTESWAGLSSTVIHAAELTTDTVARYGKELGVVMTADGKQFGTELDGFHLRETEGRPASVFDTNTESSYFVDPETNSLMRRGKDGSVEAVNPGDSPFGSIVDQGDGTFKIETKEGGQIILSKDSVRGNDGIAEAGTETDGAGNRTATVTALAPGLIDPAEFARMTPEQAQAKLAELRNLSPEELAAQRKSFMDMPQEDRMKRMRAMREHMKTMPPELQREFRQFFRQQREAAARESGGDPNRPWGHHHNRPPGAVTLGHTVTPDGTGKDFIKVGDEVVSSSETPAGTRHKIVTDHSSGEPKVLMDVNHDTGIFSTANLSRNALGDFTHLPSGTMFMSNGDILDGDGGTIYDYSSSSYGDGWASSDYDGYNPYGMSEAELAEKAEVQAKAADVSGKSCATISMVSSAQGVGAASSIMSCEGPIEGGLAEAQAILDKDPGNPMAQAAISNFAAARAIFHQVRALYQMFNTRVGNTADTSFESAVKRSDATIANPDFQIAIVQGQKGLDTDLTRRYDLSPRREDSTLVG